MSRSTPLRRLGAVAVVAAAGFGVHAAVPASAAVVGGNVSISWSIPNPPSGGLTNITYPMTVNPATAHQDGIYFAQQFAFQSDRVAGYTGLQPRRDSGGATRMRGVFSIFGEGTSTSHPNCHTGADGGPGTSCGVEFTAVYGREYHLKVVRTGTDTWTGTAVDAVTGSSVQIGSWRLPAGTGNLRNWHGGFVEYYLAIPSCSLMPRSDVVFGGPTSTDAGGLRGTSKADEEYGGCVGESDYRSATVGAGTHVTRGFVSDTGSTYVSALSNRCLDNSGGSTANGNPVVVWECHGGANQRWTPSGGALTTGGKCLDATGGSTSPGTRVITWDCHGGANQEWAVNTDGTIRGAQSGLCLTATGSANGSPTELHPCDGRTGQKWTRR
ncbi:ricin-type beta-trefoil lectin domain protein [Actinokineospora soli]|uniref:Ricin-type beta-trefoil lectin domain protein n=1 Tax=Actinokineospora soli TaxID=1048753 RepID=A0ABW2TRJ9_9PSEU